VGIKGDIQYDHVLKNRATKNSSKKKSQPGPMHRNEIDFPQRETDEPTDETVGIR